MENARRRQGGTLCFTISSKFKGDFRNLRQIHREIQKDIFILSIFIMDLNIYFCGSIRGGRDDAALYLKIVNYLKEKYGKVLTEHVADPNVMAKEGSVPDSKAIHDRDVDWLKSADVIVAEVTQVSMGVGYELGYAMAIGKPVLAMYRPSPGKMLTCMVEGAHNGTTFVVEKYQESEAFQVIDNYFSTFKKA